MATATKGTGSRAGLVLASSSPYRRALLERLKLPFVCRAPAIDETPYPGESAPAMVERLAVAKARAVAVGFPGHYVIGSDQAATVDDRVIGKPATRPAAAAQLRAASGRKLIFHTGVCVIDAPTGRMLYETVICTVQFRALSEPQIEAYLDADRPYDCAGGFKAEELGIALCERIESEDPTALIGLPLIAVVRLLDRLGFDTITRSGTDPASSST